MISYLHVYIGIVPLLYSLDSWNMQAIVYSGSTGYKLMSGSSSFHEENAKQEVKEPFQVAVFTITLTRKT